MTDDAKSQLKAIEDQQNRRQFMELPLETRLRNTCPACGCRLTEDFARALVLVMGPPKYGRCQKCGWCGTK